MATYKYKKVEYTRACQLAEKEKFTTVRISIEQNEKLKELAQKEKRTKLGELYFLIDRRTDELIKIEYHDLTTPAPGEKEYLREIGNLMKKMDEAADRFKKKRQEHKKSI